MIPEEVFNRVKHPDITYPYRFCRLYISEKYKQILFVPMGKIKNGTYQEQENIIVDNWPCDFGKLQNNIEEILKRFASEAKESDVLWPAFNMGKAKTRKSFDIDYLLLRLETDKNNHAYGEAERINVRAQPSKLENTYYLVGQAHLIKTEVAQVVIDIFNACIKIRS